MDASYFVGAAGCGGIFASASANCSSCFTTLSQSLMFSLASFFWSLLAFLPRNWLKNS